MGHFFTVRAFIDCDNEELEGIREMVRGFGVQNKFDVEPEIAELYRRGWCFRAPMNWVQHAFYGGSVKSSGRLMVLDDLKRIAEAFPEVEGMVIIDDDDFEDREGELPREVWSIKNGKLLLMSKERT